MNGLQKEKKRYLRKIRSLLLVDKSVSTGFMAEFAASVDAYISGNEPSSFEEVRAHFGEPETIAKAFLSESDLRYVKKKLLIRKIVLLCGVLAVLIWACAMTFVAIDAMHTIHEEYYVEYGPYDAQGRPLNNPLVNMEP